MNWKPTIKPTPQQMLDSMKEGEERFGPTTMGNMTMVKGKKPTPSLMSTMPTRKAKAIVSKDYEDQNSTNDQD